jgi:hypothetical protein
MPSNRNPLGIDFEWLDIPGEVTSPKEYVLRLGNPNCQHKFREVKTIPNYGGQCRVCDCGRVETSPAPGELAEFHGMTGEYIVQEDGRPGPGLGQV